MNRREFFRRSAKTAAAIAIALNLGIETVKAKAVKYAMEYSWYTDPRILEHNMTAEKEILDSLPRFYGGKVTVSGIKVLSGPPRL